MNNRKTGRDLAPYLQLCIWGRAEEPGKLEHMLAGSQIWRIPWISDGPPEYVADHPALKYLGKKLTNFLHDFRRQWFPSLGLPAKWETQPARAVAIPQARRYAGCCGRGKLS